MFCGPCAISSLTGLPVSDINYWLKGYRRTHEPIEGVYPKEFIAFLTSHGFSVKTLLNNNGHRKGETSGRFTVRALLAEWDFDDTKAYAVVMRTDRRTYHIGVINRGRYLCTHTDGKWVSFDEAPLKTKTVYELYAIEKIR